jgi:DNA-binding Lrp family transcriptional regulator
MTSTITLKNPQKILNALAVKPMTKWELKQKTKLEYPRVHEAISLLENDGYAKAFDTIISQRGREMKLYGLTFKGVVAYLASILIIEPAGIDPLRKGESIEAFRERHEKEKELYLKELEKITRFLETYGKVLDYAIFKEIRWLADRYGHYLFHDILDIAKLVNALQPFPSGAMQLIKQSQKQMNELKKQKWLLLREPELKEKIKTTITEEGKIVETDYYDPLAEVNEELRNAEEQLKILRSQENKWWSMGFAARFAERYQISEGKGDMHNETLHKFFEQVADHFRHLEVESSEKMAKVFRGSTV